MKTLFFLFISLWLISCKSGMEKDSASSNSSPGLGQSETCSEQCSSDRDCFQNEVCFELENICDYPICISETKAEDYERAMQDLRDAQSQDDGRDKDWPSRMPGVE